MEIVSAQLHPALSGSSILSHVVPSVSVIDPALLHFVVFIVIPVSADISPLVCRNQGRKILVGKVNVYIAGDSGDTSAVGSLPHGSFGVGVAHIVPGNPDVIGHGVHVNFIGEPVVIGVDHGIIACIPNLPAESIDHGTEGRRRECAHLRGLHIENDRIGDGIVLNQIQNKISLLFSHLRGCGIGVNISANLQPCISGAGSIGLKKRIHRIIVSGSKHDKLNVIGSYRIPVNALLRDINPSGGHSGNGSSRAVCIDTVHFCPGRKCAYGRVQRERPQQAGKPDDLQPLPLYHKNSSCVIVSIE